MRREGTSGVMWAALALAGVYAGFVAYVVTSSAALPQRVATHFGASGRADGWMSRPMHVAWTLGGGAAVPAIVVGLMFSVRFAPDDSVNLPHKAYWLAEGRRRETMDYLLRQALWLGCWVVLFFGALQYLAVEANAAAPARMGGVVWGLVGVFAAGAVGWVAMLAWHFGRGGTGGSVAEGG